MIHRERIAPNNAMEPTPVNVTVPAEAGTAPFTSAAHLERWAIHNMKFIILIAGLAFMPAVASEQEYASIASVEIATAEIPRAGVVSISGKSEKGQITKMTVSAFGRRHILSGEELSRISSYSLAHISITHEAGYEVLGGYSVHIRLAGTSSDLDGIVLTFTETKGLSSISLSQKK